MFRELSVDRIDELADRWPIVAATAEIKSMAHEIRRLREEASRLRAELLSRQGNPQPAPLETNVSEMQAA